MKYKVSFVVEIWVSVICTFNLVKFSLGLIGKNTDNTDRNSILTLPS